MDPTSLTALSPLDGRYARKAAPLRHYLSEYALIRYRTLIEVRWLQHLADEPSAADLAALDPPLKDVLNHIVDAFSIEDAKHVKAFEAMTNHDVKAVEYFLQRSSRASPPHRQPRRRSCTSPARRRTSTTWPMR